MALAFSRLSMWLLGNRDSESTVPTGSSLNSSSDLSLGLREMDSMKFSAVKGSKVPYTSRRVKRKWQSREERKIDRELDLVLVPPDAGCVSGSESDDSDWSIGWLEPHAPDFLCEDEKEDCFSVLVPCYARRGGDDMENLENQNLSFFASPQIYYNNSNESKKYMEKWLLSLTADIHP